LSPATQALDMAAKAFPIFQPRPKLVDEHPLMAPPPLAVVPGLPTTSTGANVAVATSLMILAVLTLVQAQGRRHWLSRNVK